MLPSGISGGMGDGGVADAWLPLLYAKGVPALASPAAPMPDVASLGRHWGVAGC